MTRKILTLNAGSSSIKFQLFDTNLTLLAKGLCERIFVDGAFVFENVLTNQKQTSNPVFNDHTAAFNVIIAELKKSGLISDVTEITGVGHRVVQGGNIFHDSTLVTPKELAQIRFLNKLAPLHNPHEANLIEIVMQLMPQAQNVAVFDTTFHATLPPENYRYAIPHEWETKHLVRRYGAHGTSYAYITERMEAYFNKKPVNLVVCHIGNGASMTAIKDSQSYDTSMGFTPIEGLVMGTRPGDLDVAIIDYMCDELKKSPKEITNILNKEAGMLGLTGSSDLRDVYAQPQKNAVAIAIYTQRIANYILRYVNELHGQVDGIVFTAGVGENGADVLTDVLKRLPLLDLKYDEAKLADRKYADVKQFDAPGSRFKLFQVRTNEELMIAKIVKRLTGQ